MPLAVIIVLACLSVLVFRRGLHAQFRYFFVYMLYAVVTESVRLATSERGWTHYYIYWTTEAVYAILAFFAIYEVFHSVFRNFDKVKGFRYLFPSVGLFMAGVSIIRAVTRPENELVPYLAIIIALKIAVGFLQVGLFSLFILLVRLFRVQSRRYAFGIALGFGISASGDLSFFLLRSEFGTKLNHVVGFALPIVYIIAVAVWLFTFIQPQSPHPWQDGGPALQPEELIIELRHYTKVAKGVLRR